MAPKNEKAARTEELEREYIIPLRASQHQPSRRRRAGHALLTVRRFIGRHMKGTVEDVWIDPRLNEHIWERGVQHIPASVRVKAIRFEDGLIEVDLVEGG
jgi:large subunit ribosomal protein L31e